MQAIMGAVGAVLLSAALVYAGNGLQSMALPLRGVAEGFPTTVLGLLGSAYAVGFMAGCLYGPRVIRRVGHIRALAVFAAIAANSVLVYVIVLDPLAWIGLRVVGGAALAGMYLVIESWLNESADNTNRGRIFGIYMVVNYVAVTLGQMTAALGDPRSFELFALSCIGICAALVPVGLTTKMGPAPVGRIAVRLGHLYRISPVGAVGALLIGISSGAFGTLAAVFVSRIGFSTAEAALFVSAAILGAAFMQLPAGYLSDRVDRRWLIIGLATCAALTGLWMTLSGGDGPAGVIARSTGIGVAAAWIAGSFVFGAFAYPLYGVSVAHMNDHVEADGFVEASSGFLLLWSVGAMAGPFLAALAMSRIGPNALFLTTASAHALLALFAVYRMTRRAAPSGEEKSVYVPTGAVRTTQMAATLDPRAPGDDE